MSQQELNRILLAGGTSTMGTIFAQQLIKSPRGYEVGILTRGTTAQDAAKKAAMDKLRAEGIQIVEADYATADTLASALQGWDAVVSVLGKEGLAQQELLIAAAAKAGTKRFLPSEWGLDISRVGRGIHPVYDRKLALQQALAASGVPYTLVCTGLFMELVGGRMDAAAQPPGSPLTVCGSGNVAFTALCWEDIGALLADVLADPSTANQTVVLTGDSVTWNSALRDYNEVTGSHVAARHVSSWLVYAKKAVTRNPIASFPLAAGLLLDKGLGLLAGGWNTQPGKTAHKPMAFAEFVRCRKPAPAAQQAVAPAEAPAAQAHAQAAAPELELAAVGDSAR